MHRRTLMRALPAAVAVAAATAIAAPAADASFTIAPCSGNGLTGRGATFQGNAQASWIAGFPTAAGCSGFTGTIAYQEQGSGAGRRAFGGSGSSPAGTRDTAINYIGYDEPPADGEQSQMEAGASPTGAGNLHTVPVVGGAITVSVNFPDGCSLADGDVNKDGTGSMTDATGTARIKAESDQLEQVFAGDSAVDTWGELVPGITGAGCSAKPIIRALRRDSSGTTFAFKQWLNTYNASRGWTGLANTSWPNAPAPLPSPQNDPAADENATVKRGDGNNEVAGDVVANDGSIGYVDLATARDNGFSEAGAGNDDKWWIRIYQNTGQDTEALVEPSTQAVTSSTKGANCGGTSQYRVTQGTFPTSTLDDNWEFVTGIAPTTGYAICTLTYIGAWEDYADVYGNTLGEQQKARTVNDYVRYILSTNGQTLAQASDYSRLPGTATTGLLGTARAAADSGGDAGDIGWNN